mmetsp:Transcript_53021/g.79108  ORF Transcript_53021/g.79108 Transcript_53021/m.79108 type:complete len:110 (+) Transcript_53021:171-500(+)
MEKRFSGNSSNINIGQINDLLDELVLIKSSRSSGSSSTSSYAGAGNDAGIGGSVNHNWRAFSTMNSQSSSARSSSSASYFNKRRQRVRWVEKIIGLGLSVSIVIESCGI